MNKDLSNMRENYQWGHLLIEEVDDNPYAQFKLWLDAAVDSNLLEANAMNLSTSNANGRPSSRIVLLKEIEEDGFIFYTNYESRKSKDLSEQPFAALNFLWKEIERQVRIEGLVEKISRSKSEAYFHSRPYGSQIGAITSNQSKGILDRKELENRYQENYEKYKFEGKVPLPANWGGYKLKADYFEFWQGRERRLHDRISYRLVDNLWQKERLEP